MARKKAEVFELGAESSLAEAAKTLWTAADMAEKMNDTEAIMNVVAGWLELHDKFRGVEHDRPKQIGFVGFADREPEQVIDTDAESEMEVEVEDGSDEG